MTTIGKKGLGQRHSFTPINQSPKELQARALAQAERTIEKLSARIEAIEGTLKIVNKLSAPYVAKREDRRR